MKNLLTITIAFIITVTMNAQTYNIKDFGAKPDNATLNTKHIQNAIDSCFAHGGGKVYVPAGVFITGTLLLTSNINLPSE